MNSQESDSKDAKTNCAISEKDFEIHFHVPQQEYFSSHNGHDKISTVIEVKLKTDTDLICSSPGKDIVMILDLSPLEIGQILDPLEDFMSKLNETDRISFVLTSCNRQELQTLTNINNLSKISFIKTIKSAYENKRLTAKQAFNMGVGILKQRKIKNEVAAMFYISRETKNINLNQFMNEEVGKSTRFLMYTFGIGKSHDPILLDDISNLYDGLYFYSEDFDTLWLSLEVSINELDKIIAKKMSLKVDCLDKKDMGICIRSIYEKVSFETARKNAVCKRKYIQKTGIKYVIEFEVPSSYLKSSEQVEDSIQIEFKCLTLNDEQSITITQSFCLLRPSEQELKITHDIPVDTFIMKYKYAAILKRAVMLYQNGFPNSCQNLLENSFSDFKKLKNENKESLYMLNLMDSDLDFLAENPFFDITRYVFMLRAAAYLTE